MTADQIARAAQHFGQEDGITVLKLGLALEDSLQVRWHAAA